MAGTEANRLQHDTIEIGPRHRHKRWPSAPERFGALDRLCSTMGQLRPVTKREALVLLRRPVEPHPLTRR